MDAKITLSFDESVIAKAKLLAESHHISLSRLTEILYRKMTEQPYPNLEEIPVADWVHMLAEGEIEYKTRRKSRKEMKDDFYSKKK